MHQTETKNLIYISTYFLKLFKIACQPNCCISIGFSSSASNKVVMVVCPLLVLNETLAYPAEKELIISAHLKFAAWAQSGGVQYLDWYKNLSGYRNAVKIY